MSYEQTWNKYEKELLETIATTNPSEITDRKVYFWFKKASKYGTPELLQYLSTNISQRYLSLTFSELYQKLYNIGTSPFVKACNGGNFRNIDYLLSIFGDEQLNYHQPLGATIRKSLPSNSLFVAQYLIDKGANIHEPVNESFPMAYSLWACLEQVTRIKEKIILKDKKELKLQLELLKYLIEKGVDLKLKDNYGNSIKKYALESRNLKIIKYLVSLKIIDIKGDKDALLVALSGIRLNHKIIVDKEQQKSLLKLIKFLVEEGSVIDSQILHLAAEYHSLIVIKYLISLGLDIQVPSMDYKKNSLLLSTLSRKNYHFTSASLVKNMEKIAKYFIDIGVNLEYKNREFVDAFLYSIQIGEFELAKFIAPLLPTLQTSIQYSKKSELENLNLACAKLWEKLDLDMIKYLDQFPCFTNYFDGENKIISNNFILHQLVCAITSENYSQNRFRKFKEIFDFFLSKRNNINNISPYNQIPLQMIFVIKNEISRKFLDYMIEKGSNLLHLSNYGSILHNFIPEEGAMEEMEEEIEKAEENVKKFQNLAKYLLIRSMEVNHHIKLPPHDKLDEQSTFDHIILIDEDDNNNNNNNNEEDDCDKGNEERNSPVRKVARINNKEIHSSSVVDIIVHTWKNDLMSCLFKPPKIFDFKFFYSLTKVKFDENSSLLTRYYYNNDESEDDNQAYYEDVES